VLIKFDDDIRHDRRHVRIDEVATRAQLQPLHQLHRGVDAIERHARLLRNLGKPVLQQVVKVIANERTNVVPVVLTVVGRLERVDLQQKTLAIVASAHAWRLQPNLDFVQGALEQFAAQIQSWDVAVLLKDRLEVRSEQAIAVDVGDDLFACGGNLRIDLRELPLVQQLIGETRGPRCDIRHRIHFFVALAAGSACG
jgi:hypothetical protein